MKDKLIEITRSRFGLSDFELEPITNGASDRIYYRVNIHKGGSMVLMHYTLDRPDNASFAPVTRFLLGSGVAVPKILEHDTERHLMWLEDLGSIDLWHYREAPWEKRKQYYLSALEQVLRLHSMKGGEAWSKSRIELQPAFDEALYRWEQDYFFTHCFTQRSDLFHSAGCKQLASDLGQLPRRLVHRDFQSQNIMMHGGSAYLIDYQGLRLGRPEYDLASLLLDPYVDLTEEQELELAQAYAEMALIPFEEMRRCYLQCAAQRLMQALGAYGNLGRNLEKTRYFEFIPIAAKRLLRVLEAGDLIPELAKAINNDGDDLFSGNFK